MATPPLQPSGLGRLLGAAALWHLCCAALLQWVGAAELLPDLFDHHGFFQRSDCQGYQFQAAALAGELAEGNWASWWAAPTQVHVKVYALGFAALGPFLGEGTLGAETVNLPCFLALVFLVYRLTEEVFDRRAGRAAALVIAAWPSLLLHSLQVVRDPLFIAGFLGLVFLLTRWLTQDLSWRRGLATGVAAGLLALELWLVRGQFWELTVAAVLLGGAALVVRQLHGRRVLPGNLLGWAVLGAAIVLVPGRIATIRHSDEILQAQFEPEPAGPAGGTAGETQETRPALGLAGRIKALRWRLRHAATTAGSNVDADIDFQDTADVCRHLPRALLVGWFSPFPAMWLSPAHEVGRAGRLLGALETLAIYVLTPWAVAGVLRRQSLAAWLMLAVAVVGMTALGLVVVNVGSMYRERYVFWILVVLLGIGGWYDLGPALVRKWRLPPTELSPQTRGGAR
jgi:hypothetical protein